jgi:hypothetical protein
MGRRWGLTRCAIKEKEEGGGGGGLAWVGTMWRGGVGVQCRHDAGVEEVSDGRRGAATRSEDMGGEWAAPGGRGPVALGRPDSTVPFSI